MKSSLFVCLFFIALGSLHAQDFQYNEMQDKAAFDFLNNVFTGDYGMCWEQFDQERNPTLTKEKFLEILGQMNQLKTQEDQKIEYNGGYVKWSQGKFYIYYTYILRIESSEENQKTLIFDIVFLDPETLKIGGFWYKMLLYQSPKK